MPIPVFSAAVSHNLVTFLSFLAKEEFSTYFEIAQNPYESSSAPSSGSQEAVMMRLGFYLIHPVLSQLPLNPGCPPPVGVLLAAGKKLG